MSIRAALARGIYKGASPLCSIAPAPPGKTFRELYAKRVRN